MITYLILGASAVGVIMLLLVFTGSKKEEKDEQESKPDEKQSQYSIPNFKRGIGAGMRNNLILLILLLGSGLWAFFSNRGLRQVNKELTEKKTQLEKEYQEEQIRAQQELIRLEEVREQLDKIRDEVFLNNKIMLRGDNSARTLGYFLQLSKDMAWGFPFNISHTETGTVQDDNEVLYNRYIVTGRAHTNKFFSFIDQLERQAPFYTVESIALDSEPAEEAGKITFSLELMAYFTDTGKQIDEIKIHSNPPRRLVRNPFYPVIHAPVMKEDEEFQRLLDAEEATLLALSGDRAFVKNNRTGIIHIMGAGSPVRWGYLEKIDWQKQIVVFRINRIGLREYIELDLTPELEGGSGMRGSFMDETIQNETPEEGPQPSSARKTQ